MDSICLYFVKDLYFYLSGRYCFLSHCLKLGAVMVAPPPPPPLRTGADLLLLPLTQQRFTFALSLQQLMPFALFLSLCLNLGDRKVGCSCPGDWGSLLWRREVSKKVGVASCWRGLSGVTGRHLCLLWTPVEVHEKEAAHECGFSSGLGLPGILRCHVSL